jgi:hypothetical protein
MIIKISLRKIFKWILRIFIGILCIAALHFTILSYPQPLFGYSYNYGRYSVHSDRPINFTIMSSLDAVESNISRLEIFDPSFQPNIFICNNQRLYSFFTFLLCVGSQSSGVNVSLVDNTFINVTRIELMKTYHDKRITHSHLTGETAHIIAHEIVHDLTQETVGWNNYRKWPRWKSEGYAEYGAVNYNLRSEDNPKSLLDRAAIYFENNVFNAPQHSKFYYKSQLMVEYLLEIENYTFEMFRDEKLTEQIAFKKLSDWYFQKRLE